METVTPIFNILAMNSIRNKGANDEDVLIYLSHLYFASLEQKFDYIINKYLEPEDFKVTKLIHTTKDPYLKYFILKANADFLSLYLGLYQDMGFEGPRICHKFSYLSSVVLYNRARIFYTKSSIINEDIYRKKTAVGIVLDKLSKHFDTYVQLLRISRRDLMLYSNTVNDRKFEQFMETI